MAVRARAALFTLLGALLLGSLVAGPAGAAPAGASDGNVTFEVALQADGDARWTVTVFFDLDSAAEREAFGDLADAYERGETRGLGVDTARNASREAAAVTGRQMRIEGVRRGVAPTSAVENGTGWLSVSFTWTNFARVGEDGNLVVGDAFNTTEGTWLRRLAPDDALVITPPESHNPFTGDCELTERSFRCTGPMTFSPGSPSWVFTEDGTPQDGLATAAMVVAGLALLLVVVYFLASRRGEIPGRGDVEDAVAGGADDGTAAEGTGADEPDVDLELLSDEERVEHLLDRNGGRMKQATIVKETGWSNAKVSQLLSSMEEEGRIDKLRIGRENLISFPDEDVADVDE